MVVGFIIGPFGARRSRRTRYKETRHDPYIRDRATKPGEEYPELYTSGMIADELQVSGNRVRNILDNWCVCGPVIHIGRVKLYSSETFDQVARALSQIDSMAEKEDVCDD